MKNINIKIALLLCGLPMVAFANNNGPYNNYYNDYESAYSPQEYYQKNYGYSRQKNYGYSRQESSRSGYKIQDIRFFVCLNTSLINYDQTEITYNNAHVSEKQTSTKVNYDVFDKAGFVFGIDSDNGFRLSLGAQHYNTETKFVDGSDDEASVLALGLMLDIPFVKKETTSPFFSLGVNYIEVDQNDINIKFPAYYVGLGVTHNFTKDMFGMLRATYAFMAKADISEVNASYKENAISIGMGIGYRF